MLPEEENEYTLYEDADNTIPKLLERMLNEVEFENVFYKKRFWIIMIPKSAVTSAMRTKLTRTSWRL